MGKSIDINLEDELGRILDEYMDDVEETATKVINQVAREAAQKLKDESPYDPKNNGKHYRDGWTVRRGKKLDAVVYNATKPWLTHLLENGHVVRNQYGTYDPYKGKKHIKPVREWAEEEVVKRIEEALE